MDDTYDVIVLGTGLKECILSGLLSSAGKKVLHIDRNNYYGGDSASLNLTNLYKQFHGDKKTPPAEYGANRDWNVDLIPKFIMAGGKLVQILLKTKVTKYLEWRVCDASYVYQYQAAGIFSSAKYIHKVPASDSEALKSPLMGLLEKNRCKNFFQFIDKWNAADSSTLEGVDPQRHSMAQVFEMFGLEKDTIDYIGHAVALHTSDDFLAQACGPTIGKIQLYMQSFRRYGQSPFVYPIYGLGGLPEGFSRQSAIHGGVYMLNKKFEGFRFADDGRVTGVTCDGETASAPLVICDPSYVNPAQNPGFENAMPSNPKLKSVGKLIRCICIMSHPIPNTDNSSSCQIIIPQSQLKRQSDVYVMMVSASHMVSAKGKFIATISATCETGNPSEEIRPALELIGVVEEQFLSVSDVFQPLADGAADGLMVTSSFDATSHFESATEEVLQLWQNISGEALDLSDLGTDLDNEDT